MPRHLLFLVVCLATLCLTGCNIIAGAAMIASPPQLVDAKHELADKPTLVVIDDWRGLVNNEPMLRRIAGATRAALEAEEVVTTGFIGQDQLAAYREELGDAYNKTSLAALAIHLDAKQVIHAEVTGYQIDLGGTVIRPKIMMNIKVFDLDERRRVFPAVVDSGTGVTVYSMQSRMGAKDISGRGSARAIAARELADQTGRDIGRLFFDWRKPEPGAELGKR